MKDSPNPAWSARQSEMEDWYRDFLGNDRAEAEAVFLGEYQPYAPLLRGFRGRIVDVGGGAGFAGRFLPTDSDYIVVDPSPLWEEPEWRDISARFTGTGAVPTFIHGTGEALPFEDAGFDGLLAFWSFNHAADPFACLDEAFRVVKPGGPLLIVLEDMIPNWGDVARMWIEEKERRYLKRWRRWPIEWHQPGIETARATAANKLSRRAWPLQNDHVRIEEPAFCAALKGRFKIIDRNWDGGFLSYELRRTA